MHRNSIEDVVVFVPAERDVEIVKAMKICNRSEKSQFSELTTFEKMMAYNTKIVPNHERDFPEIVEIPVPKYLWRTHTGTDSSVEECVGVLVGAFEIPVTPGVVVDVWRTVQRRKPDSKPLSNSNKPPLYWTTTPIDSVAFAVLERMFVVSVSSWGVPSVVQVDIFGRHPQDINPSSPTLHRILLESVTAGD